MAQRLISAAIMLPVAGLAIWLGGWAFTLLVAGAAGLMYWEWQRLCGNNGNPANAQAALCALTILLYGWAGPAAALVAGLCVGLLAGIPSKEHRLYLSAGLAYILLACIGAVWLRGNQGSGLGTVVWLLAVVVATDTAAYFTGRTLGGPKLAPKTSPKKTWSGLYGGIVGAAIAGGVVAAGVDGADVVLLALLAGVFAMIAQAGDLLVSKAKRTFDVKDSSNLIPGHGGVLDRLDGFLSAALAMTVLTLIAGRSPLTWL